MSPARAGFKCIPERCAQTCTAPETLEGLDPKQHKVQAVAKQLQSKRIGRAAPLRSPCCGNNLRSTHIIIMQKQPSQVRGAEYSSSRCRRACSGHRVPPSQTLVHLRSLSYLILLCKTCMPARL